MLHVCTLRPCCRPHVLSLLARVRAIGATEQEAKLYHLCRDGVGHLDEFGVGVSLCASAHGAVFSVAVEHGSSACAAANVRRSC